MALIVSRTHARAQKLTLAQPYTPTGTSAWRKDAWAAPRYSLASPASPARALVLIRDNGLHRTLADFDDHLDDVALDWLHNPDSVDPDPPK